MARWLFFFSDCMNTHYDMKLYTCDSGLTLCSPEKLDSQGYLWVRCYSPMFTLITETNHNALVLG